MPEAISSADGLFQTKSQDRKPSVLRRALFLHLWWDSLPVVSVLFKIAKWSGAFLGILILVLASRHDTLRNEAQAAEKANADAEKAALNKAIAARDQDIEKLKPKPLKDRVLVFLKSIDPAAWEGAQKGSRTFEGRLTYAQVAELQRLCTEDKECAYIKQLPSNRLELNGPPGTEGVIKFAITDDLMK
jgi:hypothetical protein